MKCWVKCDISNLLFTVFNIAILQLHVQFHPTIVTAFFFCFSLLKSTGRMLIWETTLGIKRPCGLKYGKPEMHTNIWFSISLFPSMCPFGWHVLFIFFFVGKRYRSEALCYKLEGRGSETRWGEYYFFILPNPSNRTRPRGRLLSL
jgi:hypothetical protein